MIKYRLEEVVISRDATPSLFSALGKVLHCKRVELLAEPKSLIDSNINSSSTTPHVASSTKTTTVSLRSKDLYLTTYLVNNLYLQNSTTTSTSI